MRGSPQSHKMEQADRTGTKGRKFTIIWNDCGHVDRRRRSVQLLRVGCNPPVGVKCAGTPGENTGLRGRHTMIAHHNRLPSKTLVDVVGTAVHQPRVDASVPDADFILRKWRHGGKNGGESLVFVKQATPPILASGLAATSRVNLILSSMYRHAERRLIWAAMSAPLSARLVRWAMCLFPATKATTTSVHQAPISRRQGGHGNGSSTMTKVLGPNCACCATAQAGETAAEMCPMEAPGDKGDTA